MQITVVALGANSPPDCTLQRWLSSLAFAVQLWDAPPGAPPALRGAAGGCRGCDLGEPLGLEAENLPRASVNPLHLSLMPGVSSVGCQHSLRPRASLLLALPSPCLWFHWNRVKRRRVHAGSGTDQQVSWECLSGSQHAPSLLPGFLWGL